MKASTVRNDLSVQTWVGILAGLLLFVAFYAGALTMLAPEITPWERPALTRADARDAPVHLAQLDAQGALRPLVSPGAEAGHFVDLLHRKGGLPLDTSEPVIGIVSMLYALALISGVVVLLPSLVKDLFVVRLGRNVKRLWLDLHNLLGVASLPFHVVMALAAAVFCLHDWVFVAQGTLIYPQGLHAVEAQAEPLREPVPLDRNTWRAPTPADHGRGADGTAADHERRGAMDDPAGRLGRGARQALFPWAVGRRCAAAGLDGLAHGPPSHRAAGSVSLFFHYDCNST